MNFDKYAQIEYLFFRYTEGSITEEEMKCLNTLLLNNESFQRKYFVYLKTVLALNHSFEKNVSFDSDQVSFQNEFLLSLFKEEQTAPTIKIPKEESKREVVRDIIYQTNLAPISVHLEYTSTTLSRKKMKRLKAVSDHHWAGYPARINLYMPN